MHKMDKTPRILTIIGLVFEGFGVLGAILGYYILSNFESLPGVSAESMDLSEADFQEVMQLFVWLANVIGVLVFVLGAFFIVSLFLLTKLLGGRFTDEQAKKVYLYQAIWGGFNLLSNQVTGILYLISGVAGFNGHHEETDIRDGI